MEDIDYSKIDSTLEQVDKDLREIRYEIFFNEEKRKFLRFTAYHYDIERLNKVYYDNKLGEVISVPVQSLSSMEPLNPLLLFDKIKVLWHQYSVES